jgi:hypothetical protein
VGRNQLHGVDDQRGSDSVEWGETWTLGSVCLFATPYRRVRQARRPRVKRQKMEALTDLHRILSCRQAGSASIPAASEGKAMICACILFSFFFLLFENHMYCVALKDHMYCVAEMMNLLPDPTPWQSGNHVCTPASESRAVGIETVSVRAQSVTSQSESVFTNLVG